MRSIPTIINRRTLEETTDQVTQAFPYRADYADLTVLPGGVFPWHWHNDVELFYMKEGALEYQLPSGVYYFGEGDAGFLNSGILHLTRSVQGLPCQQQEHIFLPSLVGGEYGSRIHTQYVLPLVSQRQTDLMIFRSGTPEAKYLQMAMDQALDLYEQRPVGYELRIRALMSEVWLRLLEAMPGEKAEPHRQDEERIKKMLAFIAQHYGESLTLSQIAEAAFIGKRECTRCFQRQLNMSPFDYLLRYRVGKACEFLRKGNDPIASIGSRCGFATSSYFGKMFRQITGVTPSAYRTGSAG